MATLERSHELHCRLAADKVDSALGIIRGCTAAKAGVQAIGKVVMLDAKGQITRDEKLAKKKLPVFTDQKTLETLMTAAKAAGGRVKTREDHNDAIAARAGFSEAFKLDGDRVACDVHLFDSYKNRLTVLETAEKTPDEIGLSIDFVPTFEIVGDKAFMRVKSLEAVDIVDAGAITPGGLLLSAGVDSKPKDEPTNIPDPIHNTNTTMAAEPTLSDIMSSVTKLAEGVACLSKTVGDHGAALSKLATPPTAPAADPDKDAMKASLADITTKLGAVSTALTQMKRERALLGFKGTAEERAKLSSSSAEDIEQLSASKKTYLQLVEETATKEKCSKVSAHERVQKTDEGKAAYALHLAGKGVTKMNMAA